MLVVVMIMLVAIPRSPPPPPPSLPPLLSLFIVSASFFRLGQSVQEKMIILLLTIKKRSRIDLFQNCFCRAIQNALRIAFLTLRGDLHDGSASRREVKHVIPRACCAQGVTARRYSLSNIHMFHLLLAMEVSCRPLH